MTNQEVPFFTTKHLFNEVKNWLRKLKAENPWIATVLDAPAGAGALTKFMREELRLETFAVELDRKKWVYNEVEPILTDLGRPLDLPDESFDLVVCMEGLKHFTDVSTAIAEFSRILKPEAFLLLTIPNDLCLQSRLRYTFDGWVDTDWIRPMEINSQNEKDNFHLNSLVSLPYLSYLLEKNSFRIERTGTDRLRFWSVLLAIMLYPLIYVANASKLPRGHWLRNEMLSMKWMAGRRNLILCRKYKSTNDREDGWSDYPSTLNQDDF